MGDKYDGSKGPPDIHGMTSLKVDNLTYRTTMDDLDHYFKKFGKVGDIYIPRDRKTLESRGFAFVRYYDERDADEAMDLMDGKVIDGREIRVAMARYGRPDKQFDPRGRGGGRRDDRSDRRGYRDSGYRDRRRSPRRRSRSRSRSHSRRRSRSLSRSPRRRQRSPFRSPVRRPRSPAKSPLGRSRSPARSHSRSPPVRRHSRSSSKSRSRSHSRHSRDD